MDDPIRDAFYSMIWNQITTPIAAEHSGAVEELLTKAQQAGLVADNAASVGGDDCIVIWPKRGLVGTTSVFPRMHNLQHRGEIALTLAESAERRLAEAEEKYARLPRSVAPDYKN